MATFSWSDTVKAAFSTCLPCLWASRNQSNDVLIPTNDGIHRIARARPDELLGLLADVGDTDTEAETHSLHSDLDAHRPNHRRSRQSRRTTRRTKPKSITFLGWNLFGKPAIRLPADNDYRDDVNVEGGDGDDHLSTDDSNARLSLANTKGHRKLYRSGGSQTTSSNTLDEDAASLDPSTIDQLSSAQLQERALATTTAAEEERQQRHQRRKERKELKRAARALAVDAALDGDTFEGFPGSGGYPRMPSPFDRQHHPPPNRDFSSREAFGPFVDARPQHRADADADDADDDADLGGEHYTRRSLTGSNSGSDSRTGTSSSGKPSQQPPIYTTTPVQSSLPPPRSSQPSLSLTTDSDRPYRKNKKSRSSATSQSTSQSPSLPSPVLPTYTDPRVAVTGTSLASPYNDHGFPSPGFGPRNKNRDLGVFLAQRGDL